MKYKDIFDLMIAKDASDAFLRAGTPVRARIYKEVKIVGDDPLTEKDVAAIVSEITTDHKKELLEKNRNCEFALWYGDRWRFRVAIFYQKDSPCVVIRKIDLNTLEFDQLNLPMEVFTRFCKEKRGLVLLTGVSGSGKSTAIAAMIEHINRNLGDHIITIEEPIEFVFEDKKSLINQRELGADVFSYEEALRQSMLHSPDLIYIGNIRDRQTCQAALTVAETGVLVFSTLHTINAPSTIERIVNFFPPEQHHLIFHQLSFLLKGVISMRLVPRQDKEGLIPAYEVMTLSPTISTLILKKELWEIPKTISSSKLFGMKSFNQCLIELVRSRTISAQAALENSDEARELKILLSEEDFL